MIDLFQETIVSLRDAAKLCPSRRRGKKPHISCLYRWTKSGCRGVRLESLQVGGTRCTSKQALRRFFEALTRQVAACSVNEPVLLVPEDEVSRRLAADGFGEELGSAVPPDETQARREVDTNSSSRRDSLHEG